MGIWIVVGVLLRISALGRHLNCSFQDTNRELEKRSWGLHAWVAVVCAKKVVRMGGDFTKQALDSAN